MELATSVGVLAVVMSSVLLGLTSTQDVFLENQTASQLQVRAQVAMDRVVDLTSQALTDDADYTPLEPVTSTTTTTLTSTLKSLLSLVPIVKSTTEVLTSALRFRTVEYVDSTTGAMVYSTDRVYVGGPSSGTYPSKGIFIGFGTSMAQIHSGCAGPDGVLGTLDDVTNPNGNASPRIELLVPSTFSPTLGEMLVIDSSTSASGRLLTITLRLNARGTDGSPLFPQDLVLSERVALRR